MLVIDPTTTDRAMSYELFINAPMPMVTIHKTIEITKLVRFSKRKKLKLNMLLNYCIGFVASQIKEFKLIPVEKKLVQYDRIGVSVIVDNKEGGINSCSIPFSEDLQKFNEDYLSLTNKVRESCENYDLDDYAIVGSSSLPEFKIDGVCNMYSGMFNNPLLCWGGYDHKFLSPKTTLKVSFQFHHVQMDGRQACVFLEGVERCVNSISINTK